MDRRVIKRIDAKTFDASGCQIGEGFANVARLAVVMC